MSDIEGFNGADLTAADFGTLAYGVLLNSDKTVMELFSFDPATIASTSISFVYRGLQFDGDLTTEVAANKLDWTSGSTILIGTDTPQVLQWLKEYIDGIAIAGSPDMNTTTKGIAEEATQAEVDAGTATGGTSARLAVNPSTIRAKAFHDYAADSVGTDSYAITVSPVITAYATGQRFTFKAGTANTGSATLNVCSLGAKTIKKDVSTDLVTGDILQNQIVEVEYDGTNMQLLSLTSGNVPLSKQTRMADRTYSHIMSFDSTSATGSTTITHNLGLIPSLVRATIIYSEYEEVYPSYNSYSQGVATISSDGGTIAYKSISMKGANKDGGSDVGNVSSNQTTGILKYYATSSAITSYQLFTLSEVGTTSLKLVNTKESTVASDNTQILIEIIV